MTAPTGAMTEVILCCGWPMLWCGYSREGGRWIDLYMCHWCGRVERVDEPAVSPRYLRVSPGPPCT